MSGGGTTRGKNDTGAFGRDPASFDPSQGFLQRVGVDAKMKSAGGKFRAVSLHRGLQPAAGGGVIVLGKHLAGTGEAGAPWGEIGAEEEEVTSRHALSDALQKGKRIEVGQDPEEGDQAGEDSPRFMIMDF